MHYETFEPNHNLKAIIKCFWVLEIPHHPETPKQRVVPDGCIEMCFILGDDVKRYISEEEYSIQPRAMVIGQITKPYIIQPIGHVKTFAVRFYPYGFANFIQQPLNTLADKETPLEIIFGTNNATLLNDQVINAKSTEERMNFIEEFLLQELKNEIIIDKIVQSTIETLSLTKGNASVQSMLRNNLAERKSLERKFSSQVGITPKRLGKIIRLQAALKSMLNGDNSSFTQLAYENDYYDQSHFIRDFKEFTGTNPRDYFTNEQMMLSSLIYSKE